MSAVGLAFTAAALGLIVVGVSRTLLVLGLVGRDGDDDGGSESSDGGRRAGRRNGRGGPHGHHHGHGRGHVSDGSAVAARSATDEGELWHRGGEGAARWLEGGGGDGDDSLWEDDEGAWDDASAAGQETLYDSGTDA